MYMPTNKLPMPSQIKTKYPKYTRSPKPHAEHLLHAPTYTIQFIQFANCHNKFPEQALMHKHAKYDPLINNI